LPEVVQWYEEFLKASNNGPAPAPAPTPVAPGFRRHAPEPAHDSIPAKNWPTSVSAPVAPAVAGGTWSAPETDEEQQGDTLQLQPEESPEGLMQAFLAYVKESKKGASELSRLAEVSYPTMLTWLKGVKVPRGNNIGKLQAFLAKVRNQA
jgi:hypothetical protein